MAILNDDLNCCKVLKLFLQSCSDLFFSYLTNRELGVLDRIITDVNLRKIYFQHAAIFYQANKILSLAELEWIMKRDILLTKCHLDFYFENPKYSQCKSTFSYVSSEDLYKAYFLLGGYDHSVICARIAARYPALTEISGIRVDDKDLLALSSASNAALMNVRFIQSTFTDVGIETLCMACPYLKRISLEISDWEDGSLSDASVRSIAKYCPKIEHLSLSGWGKITDDSMVALTALKVLKGLNLNGCYKLTSAGVQGLLRVNGANLEVLTLSDDNNIFCYFCNDALLRCIGSYCPNLKHLSAAVRPVTVDIDITEATLIALAQRCSLLETLTLHSKINDAVLIKLAYNCPLLTKVGLHFGSVTDIGIAALAGQCTRLTTLALKYQYHLTHTSFTSIAMHCKGLQELNLSSIPTLTDQSLSLLFPSFRLLTDVTLSHLPLITDCSILMLVRCCFKLKKVELNYLPLITDRSAAAMVVVEELQDLSIRDCASLTEHTIRSIASYCHELTSLTIMSCPLISDRAVIDILTYGKRLAKVVVAYCNVTLTAELKDIHLQRRSYSAHRVMVDLTGHGRITL